MVISGAGPNLAAVLPGSQNQAGFPDPDLFDHFAHSRGDFLSCSFFLYTVLILRRLKGCVVAVVFTCGQHRLDCPRHLVGERDSDDEPGPSLQHLCQPCARSDPFSAQPVQPVIAPVMSNRRMSACPAFDIRPKRAFPLRNAAVARAQAKMQNCGQI